MTPLTLPTGYDLPDSGMFAVGVKGVDVILKSDDGRFSKLMPGAQIPQWAQAMADDRCQACEGTSKVQGMNHGPGDLLFTCPDCVLSSPYRPLVNPWEEDGIACSNWVGSFCVNDSPDSGGPPEGCRCTVGSAAVLAVVKVSAECLDYKPADHICETYGDGDWFWHTSGDFDERTEFNIHFPNAQDHDWAIIARMKEEPGWVKTEIGMLPEDDPALHPPTKETS